MVGAIMNKKNRNFNKEKVGALVLLGPLLLARHCSTARLGFCCQAGGRLLQQYH
jgi:hypothetical protein